MLTVNTLCVLIALSRSLALHNFHPVSLHFFFWVKAERGNQLETDNETDTWSVSKSPLIILTALFFQQFSVK